MIPLRRSACLIRGRTVCPVRETHSSCVSGSCTVFQRRR